jgi:hypothetical protein
MNVNINQPTRREFLSQAATGAAGIGLLGRAPGAQPPDQAARVPVVDCHVHVGTAHQMLVPWNTIGDPEEILRNMRKGGIDQSVPMTKPTWHRHFGEAGRGPGQDGVIPP